MKTIKRKEPWISSLTIAKKFKKKHNNIIQAIENLKCSKEFAHHNFVPSEYRDSTGRKLPMYLVSHDGFSMLVMSSTGEEAALWKEEYINNNRKLILLLENLFEHCRRIIEKPLGRLES